MLKIYNTLTQQKEEFKPINPPNVTMYACGPTVYDYFHIGNARSFIMADMIHRYLEYKNFIVKFVMNLTDVDDKIIKKANERNVNSNEIANEYSIAFFEDIEKLKIKRADVYPKATEHIEEILSLISSIEKRGFAYNVEGNVFYEISKFSEYGKLSKKNIEELESGSRVEVNTEKHNPLDFALWKKSKPDEPFWKSVYGEGRPGWHIECSAMSIKHLGETIDIHAGGNDLIFPHHENEIAQSEAGTGKKFVNYWIHFGFLNINNEKMSKSLGNFFTTRQLLKKYPAEALRFLYMQTHYGGPLNFSDELLDSAWKGQQKIQNYYNKLKTEFDNSNISSENADYSNYYARFEESMDDDFNSPKALAVIFDFIKETASVDGNVFAKIEFLEKTALGVLGIIDEDGYKKTDSENLRNDNLVNNNLIEFLISLRNDAKNEKNYNLADKIRNGLKDIGIELKDSKSGTTYSFINKG